MKFGDPIEWEQSIPHLRPSSPAWRATTLAVWGVSMSGEDEATFCKLSGGRPVPADGHDSVLVVAGRRGGKSETIARWAVFESIYGGHEVALAPGQVGVAAVFAPEHKHSKEIVGYVKGLAALPQVKRHVARTTDSTVTFKNGIEVRVVTANELAVAATYVLVIWDEAARLPGEESATPDKVIIASVTPGMAPIRGAPRRKMVGITSAFIDAGWAFETDRDNFARPDAETLVLRGSTEIFNPNIERAWLDAQRRKDPVAAAREYGDGDTPPEWQPALTECWFGADTIARCIDSGRGTLPLEEGCWHFVAIDAAFSKDNFGIAVVRNEFGSAARRTIVVYVDAFRPPRGGTLSPRDCVDRTVAIMSRYGTDAVVLDQYCAPMLIEAFADRGCRAVQIPWTGTGQNAKAIRFRDVREAMRDGNVRLPDDPALKREFHRVRGRLTQSGHETIEASGRGVDDRVSAVVMACSVAREGAIHQRQAERDAERSRRISYGLHAFNGSRPEGLEHLSFEQMLALNHGASLDEVLMSPRYRAALDCLEREKSGRTQRDLEEWDARLAKGDPDVW
jgi:hypothetical protein